MKTDKNEDQGNYSPICFTWIPGMMRKQIDLKYISNHIKENKAFETSQHEFLKKEINCIY